MTLRRCLILALFVCGCGSKTVLPTTNAHTMDNPIICHGPIGDVAVPANTTQADCDKAQKHWQESISPSLPTIAHDAAQRNRLEPTCQRDLHPGTEFAPCPPQVPAKPDKFCPPNALPVGMRPEPCFYPLTNDNESPHSAAAPEPLFVPAIESDGPETESYSPCDAVYSSCLPVNLSRLVHHIKCPDKSNILLHAENGLHWCMSVNPKERP